MGLNLDADAARRMKESLNPQTLRTMLVWTNRARKAAQMAKVYCPNMHTHTHAHTQTGFADVCSWPRTAYSAHICGLPSPSYLLQSCWEHISSIFKEHREQNKILNPFAHRRAVGGREGLHGARKGIHLYPCLAVERERAKHGGTSGALIKRATGLKFESRGKQSEKNEPKLSLP
jgi:hypothetical protein